jgi:hypothetical protein
MRAVVVWLSVALFFVPLYVRAQRSAEEMVSNCKAVRRANVGDGKINLPTDFRTGECWGAFLSFQSAIHYAGNINVDGSKSKFYRMLFGVCAPPNATTPQLIKIFLVYADRHPEQLNKDFFQVALNANKEAFPCGK